MHSSNKNNESDNHTSVNDSALVNQANTEAPDTPSFFDKPRNISIIMYSFYTLCIVLVALDFIVHRHIYLSFDKIPAFYAIYGFVACVVLVVIAKLMRHVVMRDEHYYDARLDERSNKKHTPAQNKIETPQTADNTKGDKPL